MRFELGQEVECELHGIEAGQSSRESGLRRGRTELLAMASSATWLRISDSSVLCPR